MRYWVPVLAGLTLVAAGIVMVDVAAYNLVHIGSCVSLERLSACPTNEGSFTPLLGGGILAIIAGVVLYLFKEGGPPSGRVSIFQVIWVVQALTLGGAALLAAFGPAAGGATGAKVAGIGVAAFFMPTALVPLARIAFGRRRPAITYTEGPGVPPPPPPIR